MLIGSGFAGAAVGVGWTAGWARGSARDDAAEEVVAADVEEDEDVYVVLATALSAAGAEVMEDKELEELAELEEDTAAAESVAAEDEAAEEDDADVELAALWAGAEGVPVSTKIPPLVVVPELADATLEGVATVCRVVAAAAGG
jgi:hypothetical protein